MMTMNKYTYRTWSAAWDAIMRGKRVRPYVSEGCPAVFVIYLGDDNTIKRKWDDAAKEGDVCPITLGNIASVFDLYKSEGEVINVLVVHTEYTYAGQVSRWVNSWKEGIKNSHGEILRRDMTMEEVQEWAEAEDETILGATWTTITEGEYNHD